MCLLKHGIVCCFAIAIHLASLCSPEPAAASSNTVTSESDRWVVVASKEELELAKLIAMSYSSANYEARVFQSENGWFAVVLGPFTVRTMDDFRARADAPWVPADSYLSRGKNFLSQLWPEETTADGNNGPPVLDGAAEQTQPAEATAQARLGPDEMIWELRSTDPHIVDVVLHAVSRRRAWPGGNSVYSLKDSAWHSFRIKCEPREKVCVGAGVRGNYSDYWGVGIHNSDGCKKCCFTCSGNVVRLNLTE